MVTYAEDNPYPSVLFAEHVDPTNPAAGHQRLFVDTDHILKLIDSAGTVTTYAGGGLTDPMTSRGDIIIRNSSNATARLAKGSADTYLGSDGTDVSYSAVTDAKLSTSDITTNNASTSKHGFLKKLDNNAAHFMDGTGAWSTPSGGGGGLVFLESHTASASASLIFTTFITSTYNVYEIVMQNLLPATDGVGFTLEASTDGGSTWLGSSTYSWAMVRTGGSQASSGATMPVDGFATGLVGNTASFGGLSGTLRLYNPLSTTANKPVSVLDAFQALDGTTEAVNGTGIIGTTSAVNALRFKFSSGNITSGVIRAYGIVNS